MIEVILAVAATSVAAGLYMWLPEGHRRWGVALTLFGVLLFAYAFIFAMGSEQVYSFFALVKSHAVIVALIGCLMATLGVFAALAILSGRRKRTTPPSNVSGTAHGGASIEMVKILAPKNTIDVPFIQFETQGRPARELSTAGKPEKVRFVVPIEQTVREADLPAEVRIGKGKLIIKRFTENGISFEECRTNGDTIKAEIYYAREQRSWPSLSQRQIFELRNRFAAIPPIVEGRNFRNIAILRLEFPDCADLADDIAEAFRTAWANPTILPGKPWGDFKEGIWIVGPRDDPRSPILLSILSEVLGAEYEPIGLYPSPPAPIPPLDLAVIIRIEIGRKPRRN
jgi:hypothetical protein